MQRRKLWMLGCGALLIGVCLPDYVVHRRDSVSGPDDLDLAVTGRSVSLRENGLHQLQQAVQLCRINDADRLLAAAVWAGEDIQPEDVARLLDANAAALERLREALAAPQFRLPEAVADEFEFAPEIPLETERLLELLRLQAQHNAHLGRWESAFDNAFDILRLARRIEGADRAVLTTTMLSVGYRALGLETLRRLASQAPLTPSQARLFADALPAYRSSPAAWKRMWATEYQQWKSLLAWIARRAEQQRRSEPGTGPRSEIAGLDLVTLKVQTRRTLEIFADLTRSYQRASERNCTDLAGIQFPSDAAILGSNGVATDLGEFAIEIGTPDYRALFLRRCAQDTALAATQTLIALRAFQQDQGQLPESLSDLVPSYLGSIPLDGFRGEPIQYSRTRKRVYSLGSDETSSPQLETAKAEFGFREPSYLIEF